MKRKFLFTVIISIFLIFIHTCVNAEKDISERLFDLNVKDTSKKIVDSDDYNEAMAALNEFGLEGNDIVVRK